MESIGCGKCFSYLKRLCVLTEMFFLAFLTALLAETQRKTRGAAAPANKLSLSLPQWFLPTSISVLFLACLYARRLSVSFD